MKCPECQIEPRPAMKKVSSILIGFPYSNNENSKTLYQCPRCKTVAVGE
jgi:hypothetical protein